MVKNSNSRREDSLTRERIIDASIDILDGSGESGLTFRALAQRLATGAGAIYYHIDNKGDLLTSACDTIVARTLQTTAPDTTPRDAIRAAALSMFDAIDAHPWIGSALNQAPGQLPVVRIMERLGQQVAAMGVPEDAQWSTVSALLSYILGVSGQNAANAHYGRERGVDRSTFLAEVATAWSELDADAYPFTRRVAAGLREHDDRQDFGVGLDLILNGIDAAARGR